MSAPASVPVDVLADLVIRTRAVVGRLRDLALIPPLVAARDVVRTVTDLEDDLEVFAAYLQVMAVARIEARRRDDTPAMVR